MRMSLRAWWRAGAMIIGAGVATSLVGRADAQSLLEQAVRPPRDESPAQGANQATPPGSAAPSEARNRPTMVPGPDGTMVPVPSSPIAAVPVSGAAPMPAPSFSLFQVTVPTPRTYMKHDLIEIIINESTLQSITATQDLKKNNSLKAELARFPSLQALLQEATLKEGIGTVKPGVEVTGSNNFKGEAKVNRRDQLTARITATVIDVKPNGNLVLEARESITGDREVSTMVLAGTCRSADITRNNTVQSSQLANLNLRIDREGDAKDTAEKGVITRVLDQIFNF